MRYYLHILLLGVTFLFSGCLTRESPVKQTYYLTASTVVNEVEVPLPTFSVSSICEGRGLVLLQKGQACRTLYWHELVASPLSLVRDEFLRHFPKHQTKSKVRDPAVFHILFIGGDWQDETAPRAVCEVLVAYKGKSEIILKSIPLSDRSFTALVAGMGNALSQVFEEYARFVLNRNED